MKHDVRPHASHPRCYKCGSSDIVQLCHHCTVAMCEAHSQREIPRVLFGKYRDYAGLGLENNDSKAFGAHCDDCLHFTFHMDKWVVGILYVFALILFLLSFLPIEMPMLLRGVLRLVIVGVALIFFPFWLRNKITQPRHRPKIPLIGIIQKIAIEETINGAIELNQFGEYESTMSTNSQAGRIVIEAKLNTLDRERVQKFHRKHLATTHISPLTHLGYLTLQGDTSLRFARSRIALSNARPHTIQLVDYLANNLFLLGHHTSDGSLWQSEINYRYFLGDKGKKSKLPVQIYPRVIHHRGRQWGLELMIQLAPNERNEKLLPAKMTVEKLTFQSSEIWGDPEILKGTMVWRELETEKRELEWERFSLDDEEQFPKRKSIYVRFQEGINPETLASIKGQLEISFECAFSGMTGAKLFYPTGFPRELENKPRLTTTVLVDFDLDLQSLIFHRVYTPKIKPLTRRGVDPNLAFVQYVGHRLTEIDCYVQQMIEHPPRTNFANAKQLDRAWQLRGRKYFGLYPIDFQIVITGFEDFKNHDFPQDERTACVLEVSALVDNEEMSIDRVNQFIFAVYKILKDALDGAERQNPPPPSGSPAGSGPPDSPPPVNPAIPAHQLPSRERPAGPVA